MLGVGLCECVLCVWTTVDMCVILIMTSSVLRKAHFYYSETSSDPRAQKSPEKREPQKHAMSNPHTGSNLSSLNRAFRREKCVLILTIGSPGFSEDFCAPEGQTCAKSGFMCVYGGLVCVVSVATICCTQWHAL